MALFPLKLYIISRVLFFVLLVVQPILLSKFVADHENDDRFYGLAALFVIPLLVWAWTLYHDGLKYRLATVWFLYSCVLVIMMGVIFGQAVIEDNKLREQENATCLCDATNTTTKSHSFFDSKFLKITLCFTPGIMLLLLTSVTDDSETLKQLYFTSVLDLFDGVEMIEVLHEDVCDKIPEGWEIAVLVAALLFFLSSFLEVYQVKFTKPSDAHKSKSKNARKRDKVKICKKRATRNTCFQVVLNLAFLIIRAVLLFHYEFDSAVFLAKNFIAIIIALVGILETRGYIITKSKDVGSKNDNNGSNSMTQLGVHNLGRRNSVIFSQRYHCTRTDNLPKNEIIYCCSNEDPQISKIEALIKERAQGARAPGPPPRGGPLPP